MGRLVIKVIGCQGLESADVTGGSDPFVVITAQGLKKKTSTRSGQLNPIYNESFEFNITPMPGENILFQVYDSDTLSDDFIGECRVFLDTLPRGQLVTNWYALTKVKKGKIGVEITAVDFGDAMVPGGGRGGGISFNGLMTELGMEFSRDLVSQLYDVLRRSDMDGDSTFSSTEFTRFLQEVYFFTGTPCPMDDQLRSQVKDLFRQYDKDNNAVLDMHEFCVLLLQSNLKQQIRSRWKAPPPQQQQQIRNPTPQPQGPIIHQQQQTRVYASGEPVMVQWADSRWRYGTIQSTNSQGCVVAYPNGTTMNVGHSYVHPNRMSQQEIAMGMTGVVLAEGIIHGTGALATGTAHLATGAYNAVANSGIPGQVGQIGSDAAHGAVHYGGQAAGLAADYTTQGYNAVANSGIAGQTANYASQGYDGAMNYGGQAVSAIGDYGGTAYNYVSDNAGGVAGAAWDGISSVGGAAGGYAEEYGGKAVSAVGDAIGDLIGSIF